MKTESVFSGHTQHNAIRIEKSLELGHYLLRFDGEGDAVQTIIDAEQPEQLVMHNLEFLMGILMFMPPPERILLLGVGGGALVHFLRYHLPEAHLTAVEYDGELLQLMQQHLKLPESDEHLLYVIDDARNVIDYAQDHYDLIIVDIFTDSLSSPWLLTPETINNIKLKLSAQGALAVNLLVDDEQTFSDYYSALRDAFSQQTLTLECDDYENQLIYALNFTPEESDMGHWLHGAQELSERYNLPGMDILRSIYSINPAGSGII